MFVFEGMEYEMCQETLFLAVNCIDRFLSKMAIARTKLQLIGVTALFIAAKYEELQPLQVKDAVFITDDTYTNSQVGILYTLFIILCALFIVVIANECNLHLL